MTLLTYTLTYVYTSANFTHSYDTVHTHFEIVHTYCYTVHTLFTRYDTVHTHIVLTKVTHCSHTMTQFTHFHIVWHSSHTFHKP